MAQRLSELSAQIVGSDKPAVEALIGRPVATGHWTTDEPPQGADAASVAKHLKETLDEIWIYTNGRVHFALDGKAVKVDDRVDRDLPPEQPMIV